MKTDIEKCKDLFESITCLCAEGPEFHTKIQLMKAIGKEALLGYNLCKSVTQQADRADAQNSAGSEDHGCEFCSHLAYCVCE